MEVMGIKFAPLNVPLHRRLETLAAGSWFTIMVIGAMGSYFIAFYFLFFTNYWVGTIVYLLWVHLLDYDVSERGSRSIKWMRNLSWWKYMRDYFPYTLKKQPNVELDPKKNYLFCSFPHGILSTGAFLGFATDVCGYSDLFPNHQPHLITLKENLIKPYIRELALSLGICSSSKESLNWLLRYPLGGKVVVLVVGGAHEASYSKPGIYQIVVKQRKGFIRMAMQNGTPLVPVLSFGETDLFDQVNIPEGSLYSKYQKFYKKLTRINPIIPLGRGFLQYSFGLVPQRLPITTVVGTPVEVVQNDNPTDEEVNILHETFVKQLTQLFEDEKHKYLRNPDETKLELV